MTYPVEIVYVVVDKFNLTMYKADGDTIIVPQGDPRIKELVAKVVPPIDAGGSYWLQAEDMDGKNHYAEVEKQSNGLVRFFKMAKKKFKEIAEKFCEPVAPVTAGNLPKKPEPVMQTSVTGHMAAQAQAVADAPAKPQLPPEEQRPLTKGAAAVAEVMANAVNTADAKFASVRDAEMAKETGEEEETVVAVLPDNTIIHGVEQLQGQMAAVTAGVTSADGMQLFLNRAGSVSRGHSVEDLLKFVQKGELPFADDGTVLVYKRLNPTNVEGEFVDCHSGRVKQRVGSFVHMAENLVDPNRNQDCSNGLHVARRDYLGSFTGSVVVLCKLAPEDVIAVPRYDARKLRAKGYHIIAVLSQEDANRVCRNESMNDTKLLADCIAGNHTPIIEYVEITEQRGGGLKVTAVESPEQREARETREATSLDHVPEASETPVEVDARAVALAVAKPAEQKMTTQAVTGEVVDKSPAPAPLPVAPAKEVAPAKPAPVKGKSPAQKLVDEFQAADVPSTKLAAARALVAFKKAAKKGWTALGIPVAVWTKAQEIIEAVDMGTSNPITKADLKPVATEAPTKPAKKTAKPKLPPVATAVLGAAKPSTQKKATAKPKAVTPIKAAPVAKEKKLTQQEEMAKLVKLYEANPDKMNAKAIFAFKQKSKKSWEVLGVTDVKFQKKITERAKL